MRKDELPVSGCGEDWGRMSVEAGGMRRFCAQCQTQVHDLSAMDEDQARAFLRATATMDLCLAYDHDEDGRIRFAPRRAPGSSTDASPTRRPEIPPTPALVPASRLRRPIAAPTPAQLMQLASAASVALLLGACTAHGDEPVLQVSEDPQAEIDAVTAPVLIPTEPAVEPPPVVEAEPPEAEPCDDADRPPKRHPLKGKRVGVRMRDVDDPLHGL